MPPSDNLTELMAVLAVRILAGVVFFFQGYDKLFKIGIRGVAETIGPSYRRVGVPGFFILFMAGFTSIVECIGGLLLFFGLFQEYALYFLLADLILVGFGMSLLDPVWDMKLVFPRLVMIVFLLFFYELSRSISIDSLLFP
jgi:putative oxidoreductase